ncbi:MAG: hypothetical protein U1F68_03790 [Gammaproteobacteria bacterium]
MRFPVAALEAKLQELYGPDSGDVRYFAKAVDLDGDGKPEIVVHIAGPLVCGSGGCDTLVFTPDGTGLRLVANITLTHPPILAALTRTHGWRDLIVAVGGGGIQPGYEARLRYDGLTYPENPTDDSVQPIKGHARGEVLIESFDAFTAGRPIRHDVR